MTHALVDRSQYATLSEHVYLNQASLGLLADPTVRAMHTFIEEVARHGNLRMKDEEEVAYFDELRSTAAKLYRCDPHQVAITGSASELLGQLPDLTGIDAGKEVVLIEGDFPALTRPWLRAERFGRCRLRWVEDDPEQNLTDSLIAGISDKTSVVAVSHVLFATGSKVDIPRVGQKVKHVGAILIVDATQSAGAIPIDATSWGADTVVSSGYKWLGGHGGVALSFISETLLQTPPVLPGWMGTPDPFDFDSAELSFADSARRFTLSTMSYVSMRGLTESLNNLMALGIENIAAQSESLLTELVAGIHPLGWKVFRAPGDPSGSSHLVSLSHPEIDAEAAFKRLEQKKIICGIRDRRLRFSLAAYNNSSDIDRAVAALKSCRSGK